MELSNRFQALHLTDVSVDITERYKSLETTEREVTEKVVGEREPCGLPSWVSDKTIHLKKERDKVKKQFAQSKTPQSRERCRKLNASLNDSYKLMNLPRSAGRWKI